VRFPVSLSEFGRPDQKPDGTVPAYLYEYDHRFASLLRHTKVRIAVLGIRGGGEKLSVWTKAGAKQKQHNSVSDIITGAMFLRGHRPDSVVKLSHLFKGSYPKKIALTGRSSGASLCVSRRCH
jgi:prolyl oligopeptidase PreP (S9A serine peptidase family)